MGIYTRQLRELGRSDLDLAGGKGASLGELTRAGFPVPAGFVVTTAAYTDFIAANDLAGRTPEELRDRLSKDQVPDEIAEAVLSSYRELGEPAVAVRSSGTAEDLADASFAGQHDTYLNVTGSDAVLTAVQDCWASLWTPRAVAYRRRNDWDERGLALAVVVQTMVDAEWAGVMFTADPVSGRRDRLVIEAVRGLGEALVSGEATGHHLVVDRGSGDLETDAGSPVPAAVVAELATLGARVEEAFGQPQDIEWTYAEGRCALVQARPLTALPEHPGPAPTTDPTPSPGRGRTGGWRGWRDRRGGRDRHDHRRLSQGLGLAVDHVPYPPYPMDVSLFLRPAVTAILGGLRSAGFAAPRPEEVLVEIAPGVVQIAPPRIRPTARALVGLPAAVPKVIGLLRTHPDAWLERCHRILTPLVERIEGEDLAALDDHALLDRVRALRQTQALLTPSRFGCAIPRIAVADGALVTLLRWAAGRDRGARLHTDLLSGIPCVSRDAGRDLDRLAATIHDTPDLARIYRDSSPECIGDRLRESAAGRALLDDLAAYLRTYGYRQISMPLPGFPPLRETPEVVHGMLKGLSQPERDGRAEEDDDARQTAARADLAAGRGLRPRVFGRLALRFVPAARAGVSVREDSHFYLFMVVGAAMRRVLLEEGRRLVGRGVLAEPDDVFYLEIDELDGVDPDEVPNLVARRKAGRAGALDGYTVVPADLLERGNDATAIRGTPASRGTAVGPVRVIHDESEFGQLTSGDVLVCRFTNPAWTPLFSLASAVVADAGGAGSHAAIVAREYGIPAVMGTGNATSLLTDGQRVRVDGDNGTVVPV